MMAFEPIVCEERPDWVIVVGDVNSTLACALVCAKLGVPVAHVEAGLRSRDRTMPEEINRVLTDQISDLLFTPCREADANLLQEGISPERIHFVGNVMIDTLVRMLPAALARPTLGEMELEPNRFVLATFHRPSNVDDPRALAEIVAALCELAQDMPVVFPVHPRTRQRLSQLPAVDVRNLRLLEPLGYLDFLALLNAARLVITDSGGVQEETTYLGVPCITVRPNTERPVTIAEGTNRLVPSTREAIVRAVRELQDQGRKPARPPEYWDGRAAGRIVEVLCSRNGCSG
jgi:UDP-N-acetylglucosamine 2-epimerase (non-hydrolysing)